MCRDIVMTYGMWDQIRIDKGKEWYLTIFVNERLSSYWYNTTKPPHLQTSSKKVSSFNKCIWSSEMCI